MTILILDLYLKKNILNIYNNDLYDQNNGLKHLSDKYFKGGIVFREANDTSLVYSHYDIGWYPISGNEPDHPCRGYAGAMMTFHGNGNNYVFIKLLFLINNYCYILAQDHSGKILNGGFRRFSVII